MTLGRITYALAFVAVFCVLTVFFFHSIEGPYSAVNGPVTALLSARAALRVRMAIVQAGLGVFLFWSGCVLVPISLARLLVTATYSPYCSAEGGDILRC
jgi:hypothetical protein